MIRKLLVANRGEIACRIFATCDRLNIEKLAVYSDADTGAKHVRLSDRAARIGEGPAASSYLRSDAILEAARELEADAIHPGYGFLAENSDFARKVIAANLAWIGPDPASMDAMADKLASRRLMREAGVPIVPGSDGPVATAGEAQVEAKRIGYPVIVKASGGGGGIGMTVVDDPEALEAAFLAAKGTAQRYFDSETVYLETFVTSARHVEVQVLGLNSGHVVIVGDRDCSVQRRHQKILEEAPCPGLSAQERDLLHNAARAAAQAVDYRGAGTVEMILNLKDRRIYFLEMNTRLQVEHPITELVSGIDLVEAQIQIAQGDRLDERLADSPAPNGHALEFRVYAEDPVRFLPSPGTISEWEEPRGVGIRVDSGYGLGDVVSPYYDPLMAKLCVHASSRSAAIELLVEAKRDFHIAGPKNNLDLIEQLAKDSRFVSGQYDTAILSNGQ